MWSYNLVTMGITGEAFTKFPNAEDVAETKDGW